MSADLGKDWREVIEAGTLGLEAPLDGIGAALDRYFDADSMMTRASLMNFAIYSEDPASLERNDELLQRITRDHACRALLLTVIPSSAEPRIRAWVKGQCNLDPSGRKKLCSEQISFLVEGESQGYLTNLVFSNLRSDLPLVMWWRGELSDHFEERLYSRVDRLVVDSCHWTNPAPQFERLRAAMQSAHSHFTRSQGMHLLFHDLEYTRGHQHRRAVAHVFDDAQAVAELARMESVEITYRPPHLHAALYLVAWMSGQMGATLNRIGDEEIEYDHSGGIVTFRLANRGADEGAPISLLKGSGPDLEFAVETLPEGRFLNVHTRLRGLERTDLMAGPSLQSERLVSEILMRGGRNLLLGKVTPRFQALVSAYHESIV